MDQPDLRLLWVAAQRVSGDEKVGLDPSFENASVVVLTRSCSFGFPVQVATSIRKGMKLFSIAVGASAQPIPVSHFVRLFALVRSFVLL